MMFTRDYYMMLISIFGSGMLYSIRQIMGFVYILELVPKKNRTLAVTVIYVIDALVYPTTVIYYWIVSTNWFSLILVAYCLSVVGAVACFYLPESPQFLIQLNQFDEALQVFRRIAKINGRLDKLNSEYPNAEVLEFKTNSDSIETLDDQEPVSKTPPTIYFLRQKVILANLLIMMFVWLTTSFDYYLVMFMINKFEQVYVSAIASSVSGILAYIFAGYIYE